jgi:DNA-binding MarR family transcriptional regulator
MSEEMEQLWSELFAVAGLGRRVGDEIAGEAGQTQARWQTMWTIDAGGGALTVPQIARRLGVTRQNEQRVVGDLVAAGLAELTTNPDHKTSPLARLTPEGERALASINRAAEESHRAILAEFSAKDVAELRKLVREFADAVRAHHARAS